MEVQPEAATGTRDSFAYSPWTGIVGKRYWQAMVPDSLTGHQDVACGSWPRRVCGGSGQRQSLNRGARGGTFAEHAATTRGQKACGDGHSEGVCKNLHA